jgi:hypothetical protein
MTGRINIEYNTKTERSEVKGRKEKIMLTGGSMMCYALLFFVFAGVISSTIERR